MPELPEVETLVRQLRLRLTGLSLSEIEFSLGSPFQVSKKICRIFIGKKITGVERKGKFISLCFETAGTLWLHLGMTGQLLIQDSQSPHDRHVHVILKFQDQAHELRFRDVRKFGGFKIVPAQEPPPQSVQNLGPDPFEISVTEFKNRLQWRQGRIKSLLLDQRLISGLGNIYANESLFRAGIDPRRRACKIRPRSWKRLYDAMSEVLSEAIACGGSSIDDYLKSDGSPGSFQDRHRVYGRAGESCFTCGTKIRRIVIAGRSSFFCPKCQK